MNPNITDDQVFVLFIALLTLVALVWAIGYAIYQVVSLELAKSQRRREKLEAKRRAEIEQRHEEEEYAFQNSVIGLSPHADESDPELLQARVKAAVQVHHRLVDALLPKPPRAVT